MAGGYGDVDSKKIINRGVFPGTRILQVQTPHGLGWTRAEGMLGHGSESYAKLSEVDGPGLRSQAVA